MTGRRGPGAGPALLFIAKLTAAFFLVGAFLGVGRWRGEPVLPALAASDLTLAARVSQLLQDRASALLRGDPAALQADFDTDSLYGRWAYEQEVRRFGYVQAWAERRGLRFVMADVKPRVVGTEITGDTAWVSAVETAAYGYVYKDDLEGVLNVFGIGSPHALQLVRKDGQWVIRRDWYLDPLDEDTLIPDVAPACGPSHLLAAAPETAVNAAQAAARGYGRSAAVTYADTYCGAAAGCGNAGRYNRRYRDYSGSGGNCANFASQVLGDREGGALPMDGTWYYSFSSRGLGGGSRAWLHSGALVDYLIYSGRAVLVARGRYPEVVSPRPDRPKGAIGELGPGDLIGYEEKGNIEHISMVTARDSRGTLLVNSHTADRYHVPWDIGWDRSTVYWLVRLRD